MQCANHSRNRVSLRIHGHDGAAVGELLAHDDIALLQELCGSTDIRSRSVDGEVRPQLLKFGAQWDSRPRR